MSTTGSAASAESRVKMPLVMARPSRLKLPPLDLGGESFGQRLARLRQERGYTPVELAAKIGIIQVLVSDYEHDKLRMHAEMVVRFSKALGVSSDELLGLQRKKGDSEEKLSRKVVQRMRKIEQLRRPEQRALL